MYTQISVFRPLHTSLHENRSEGRNVVFRIISIAGYTHSYAVKRRISFVYQFNQAFRYCFFLLLHNFAKQRGPQNGIKKLLKRKLHVWKIARSPQYLCIINFNAHTHTQNAKALKFAIQIIFTLAIDLNECHCSSTGSADVWIDDNICT